MRRGKRQTEERSSDIAREKRQAQQGPGLQGRTIARDTHQSYRTKARAPITPGTQHTIIPRA